MGPRRRLPSSPRVASPSDTYAALVMIPGEVFCQIVQCEGPLD
jgi:hypothetical protein